MPQSAEFQRNGASQKSVAIKTVFYEIVMTSNNLKRRTGNREEGEEVWGNQLLVKKARLIFIVKVKYLDCLQPLLITDEDAWVHGSPLVHVGLVPKYSLQCGIATCYRSK